MAGYAFDGAPGGSGDPRPQQGPGSVGPAPGGSSPCLSMSLGQSIIKTESVEDPGFDQGGADVGGLLGGAGGHRMPLLPMGGMSKMGPRRRPYLRSARSTTETYVCEVCQGELCRFDALLQHKLLHFNTTHVCYACDTYFPTLEALLLHITGAHRDILGAYPKGDGFICLVCVQRFSSSKSLLRHHALHTEGAPGGAAGAGGGARGAGAAAGEYSCAICATEFRGYRALLAHLDSSKHREMKIKMQSIFICIDCRSVFASRDSYAFHMMMRAQNESCDAPPPSTAKAPPLALQSLPPPLTPRQQNYAASPAARGEQARGSSDSRISPSTGAERDSAAAAAMVMMREEKNEDEDQGGILPRSFILSPLNLSTSEPDRVGSAGRIGRQAAPLEKPGDGEETDDWESGRNSLKFGALGEVNGYAVMAQAEMARFHRGEIHFARDFLAASQLQNHPGIRQREQAVPDYLLPDDILGRSGISDDVSGGRLHQQALQRDVKWQLGGLLSRGQRSVRQWLQREDHRDDLRRNGSEQIVAGSLDQPGSVLDERNVNTDLTEKRSMNYKEIKYDETQRQYADSSGKLTKNEHSSKISCRDQKPGPPTRSMSAQESGTLSNYMIVESSHAGVSTLSGSSGDVIRSASLKRSRSVETTHGELEPIVTNKLVLERDQANSWAIISPHSKKAKPTEKSFQKPDEESKIDLLERKDGMNDGQLDRKMRKLDNGTENNGVKNDLTMSSTSKAEYDEHLCTRRTQDEVSFREEHYKLRQQELMLLRMTLPGHGEPSPTRRIASRNDARPSDSNSNGVSSCESLFPRQRPESTDNAEFRSRRIFPNTSVLLEQPRTSAQQLEQHRTSQQQQRCSQSAISQQRSSLDDVDAAEDAEIDAVSRNEQLPGAEVLAYATANRERLLMCRFCHVIYTDQILYYLHMGLHNRNSPWQCNLCGVTCSGVQDFTSHVIHY